MNSPRLPQHIAIIMDGNRRWARQKGWEILKGHKYTVDKTVRELVDHCLKLQIPYLTLWAFSTENWKRDRAEVDGLLELFRYFLNSNGEELHEKGVRLRTIGDLTVFPDDLQKLLSDWKERTENNANITVTMALNYGGRDEITRAVEKLLAAGDTAENLHNYLDTADLPDPDLIIRPGGEKRLSGFMPWQGVYSELFFVDDYMPDFTPEKLDEVLTEYAGRQRRFGG